MEERIAHGVVEVEARTGGASAALRRIESDFDRTMHSIDRQEAEVRLLANSAQFGKEIKKAKAELAELRKVRAEAKITADTKPLDRKIRQLEKDIAFIDRMKATVDIDVDTATIKEAKSEIAGLSALEAKRNAAEAKYHRERMKTLNEEARRRSSLSDQRMREFRSDESLAHRMDVARDREKVQVLSLQREYSKLTDRIEALHKRHAFTREMRAKLTLDTAEAYAKFELVKAELNRRGAHPPVDIRLDIKRTGIRRVLGPVADIGRRLGQGLSNIPNMAVRLGPFTTSVKGLVVALGILGPSLVDVAGAATSLVGVLGTGLTGAAAIGGGVLTGLAMNLLGVKYALTPVITDFKIAKSATEAYHKAVLQYGKGSDEAAKKQEIMNNVLRDMDPRAQAAAKAVGSLSSRWQTLTEGQANTSFIHVVSEYAKTVRALQPTLAGNANRSMEILDERLTAMLTHLRTPAAIKIFDSLGRSANNFLNPVLDGLQHLGAYLGRVAESAARLFAGPVGNAFKNWARGLDAANQSGEELDGKVRRLGEHARDLGRFFLELGRLIKNVLNGSADAGDGLLVSMTKTMEGWNRFLTSTEGEHAMADFFDRSADGARALYHVFGPLIGEFVKWASALAPFVTGLLQGVNAVGSLVGKILDLVHLGGSVSVFASTLGALWAVGKIGAFISMVGRAAGAVRALGAAQTVAGLATASFGRRAAAAGAPLRVPAAVPVPAGGARAAADVEKAGAAAARSAGRMSRFRTAASGAVTSLVGLSPVALAGAAAVGGLAYGFYKLATREKDWENNQRNAIAAHEQYIKAIGATPDALAASAQANLSYNQSVQTVTTTERAAADAQRVVDKLRRQGKTGTQQYKQAVDAATAAQGSYKQSLLDEYNQRRQLESINQKALRTRDTALTAANLAHTESAQAVRDLEEHSKSVQGLLRDYKEFGKPGQSLEEFARSRPFVSDDMETYIDALADLKYNAQQAASALDLFNLSSINQQRATAGLVPIADDAAAAVGRLTRSLGQQKVAKIALKFPDAKQASSVMRNLDRTIASGVPKQRAFNVVANSATSEQALRRLNSIKLNRKNLDIIERGGREAIQRLEMIAGRKLNRKELNIVQEGGPKVIALLEKIIGKKIPNKLTKFTQSGGEAVLNVAKNIEHFVIHNKRFTIIAAATAAVNAVQNVANMLDRIQSKTVTVTTRHRDLAVKGGFAGRVIEARAAGGDIVDRALARAAGKQTITTRGGKYGTPTLLVGEENRREYVIATNPAYRENNKRYVKQAANEFGMTVIDAARHGKGYRGGKRGHRGLGPHRNPDKNPLPVVRNQSLTSDYIPERYQLTTTNRAADERAINSIDKQLVKANEDYKDTKAGKPGSKRRHTIGVRIERLKKQRVAAMRRLERDRKKQSEAHADYKLYSKYKNNIEQWTTQMNTDATRYNNTPADKLELNKNGEPKLLVDWRKKKTQREIALDKLVILLQRVKKHAPKKYQSSLAAEIKAALDDHATSEFEAAPEGYKPPEVTEKTFEDFIKEQNLTGTLSDDMAAIARAAADTPDDLTDDTRAKEKLRDDYKTLYDAAVNTGQSSDIITEAANAYVQARDDLKTDAAETPEGLSYGGQAALADSAMFDALRTFGGNTSPGVPAGFRVSDPTSGGAAWTQQNPAALSPAGTLSADSGTIGGGGSTVNKIINQTNNFPQPPADSHTFAQGVAFELGAAL